MKNEVVWFPIKFVLSLTRLKRPEVLQKDKFVYFLMKHNCIITQIAGRSFPVYFSSIGHFTYTFA